MDDVGNPDEPRREIDLLRFSIAVLDNLVEMSAEAWVGSDLPALMKAQATYYDGIAEACTPEGGDGAHHLPRGEEERGKSGADCSLGTIPSRRPFGPSARPGFR